MRTKVKAIMSEGLAILVLSVLFAILAVYDSERMSFVMRFFFWGSLITTGSLIAAWLRPWIATRLLPDHSVIIQLLALSALVAIPIPLMLLGFDTGYKEPWPIWNWLVQYCLSFIIVILIVGGRILAIKAFDQKTTAQLVEEENLERSDPTKNFLQRLPIKFRGSLLYAVCSEDHYLRVYTDRGSELILMRLSDAIRELVAVEGIQTHRSWWVARQGVSEFSGKNGKYKLLLKCGTQASVARTRIKEIRAAFDR